MILKSCQCLVYYIDVQRAKILSIDQDIIQIQYHRDVKFLGGDFVEVSLEASWCIKQIKRHNLVFKVSVSDTKDYFPVISFSNSHQMINIIEIQLGKTLGLTQLIQCFTNQQKKIPVFEREVIKALIINTKAKISSGFLSNIMGAPAEELKSQINPVLC